MSAAPRPRVGGRRAPVARLASLNKTPQPGSIPIKRPQGRLQSRVTQPSGDTCPNPNCPNPQIIEDEDMKVCAGCGTVLSEENIVSEVTFGETSSGAAIVQGSYVGADQTHTRSYGPGFQRGGGMDSREITEQNGMSNPTIRNEGAE
jgi:transcription factor IIIB subunit 2